MHRDEVLSFVINILSEATMIDSKSIGLNQALESDLGLDSIALASVLGKLEPLFSDQGTSTELIRSLLACETVKGLVDVIVNFLNTVRRV